MLKHSRHIAVIAGIVYFVQGFLGISGIALPLYLRGQSWTIQDITTMSALSAIPWILKIFYGLLSDSFPLFGYRRKSYLFLFSILSATGWLLLAILPPLPAVILVSLLLSNLGFAATDVITDGLIVEHSAGVTGPIYQSIAWGTRALGAILSGVLAGWLAANWEPQNIFLLTMLLPFIIIAAAFTIREKKMERGPFKTGFSPVRKCFELLMTPNLRFFVLILFLGSLSSSYAIPFFFHLKETLAFPETFLGFLSSLGWGGALLGSLIYAKHLRKMPSKTTLRCAMILNSINIFSTFLIQDRNTAFIFILIGGIMGCLVMLPMMSSAAGLAHNSGVEGTLFAVLMSIFNLGQILFGYAGGRLLPFVGLHSLIVIAGCGAILGLLCVERLQLDPPRHDLGPSL